MGVLVPDCELAHTRSRGIERRVVQRKVTLSTVNSVMVPLEVRVVNDGVGTGLGKNASCISSTRAARESTLRSISR